MAAPLEDDDEGEMAVQMAAVLNELIVDDNFFAFHFTPPTFGRKIIAMEILSHMTHGNGCECKRNEYGVLIGDCPDKAREMDLLVTASTSDVPEGEFPYNFSVEKNKYYIADEFRPSRAERLMLPINDKEHWLAMIIIWLQQEVIPVIDAIASCDVCKLLHYRVRGLCNRCAFDQPVMRSKKRRKTIVAKCAICQEIVYNYEPTVGFGCNDRLHRVHRDCNLPQKITRCPYCRNE